MAVLYPLRFEPIFRRYLWGGRRLATMLGKQLGDGDNYAESWEIVDHHQDQSVVSAGPLVGKTLHDLIAQHGVEIYGQASRTDSFPLLFKFLDANQRLSVQVHPNDSQAALQQPPDLGKTEAWLILHAAPGSVVYAGLKRGFDRQALEREVRRGTTELCLQQFEPRVGDCIFVPARVVHALGAGLVVAEIQQASDTTFRLFDWNRTGPDGRRRPLHVEQALDVIDYNHAPIAPQRPQPTQRSCVERLVACDKFIWDRWQFRGSQPAGGDNRFHIIAVLQGAVRVSGDPVNRPLVRGETMLIPASASVCSLTAERECVLLDAYLPS